jgi:branched-chain amino acid transport system ATP-binding protein
VSRGEPAGEALLAVENLAVRFGGVRAVDGVSFAVRRGEVFTIIGPNGAGKTTLLNLVTRVFAPSAGRVLFEGRDITRIARHRLAALGIARTFQNIELFEALTVLDNLLLARHSRNRAPLLAQMLFLPAIRRREIADRTKVEDIIELLHLEPYRNSPVAALPYGARKIVELGRALCAEPKILLLDEPASGLNPEESQDLSFWVEDIQEELGITVLMIEHNMSLVAAVSDRVLAMNQGAVLAEGSVAEIRGHPAVLDAYLGRA